MEICNEDYKNLSKNNIRLIITPLERIKDYADISNWDNLECLDADYDDDFGAWEICGLKISVGHFSETEIKVIKKFKEDFPIIDEGDGNFYLPTHFYQSYKDYREFLIELLQQEEVENNHLFGSPTFNKDTSEIVWGDIKIFIRPDTNQFDACEVLFSKKVGEEVSWDEIWEKIAGEKDVFVKDRNIKVKDAVIAVNRKIKLQTGRRLFRTGNKSHTRLF